jgi:hypothetical protein
MFALREEITHDDIPYQSVARCFNLCRKYRQESASCAYFEN